MADSLRESFREEIRACVQEELQRRESASNSQISNQTLVQRTRSLIQASASSASQALSNNERLPPTRNSNVLPKTPSSSSNKRALPNHPLRFSGKRAKPKEIKAVIPQVIPKTVYLIDEVDCVSEDYSLTDSIMVLLKGECDIKSTYSETDIRNELTDLFKAKLPRISKKDFDFVRRERNNITTPVVKAGHQWDFKHVKHLCGQGKLYVRLNVSKDLLANDEETDDDYDDIKPTEVSRDETGNVTNVAYIPVPAIPPPTIINIDDPGQSTSAGSSFIDDGMAHLISVFPEEDTNVIRDALIRYEDVELAAQDLGDKDGTLFSEAESSDESVSDVLKRLKKKMKSYWTAEKFKVDEEDLAADFFQYYKSNEFDPTIPIKIQLKGQPAVDSGGVLRQA